MDTNTVIDNEPNTIDHEIKLTVTLSNSKNSIKDKRIRGSRDSVISMIPSSMISTSLYVT